MKRSPLKRGKPLKSNGGLSRGESTLKRTELKRGDGPKLASTKGPARRSAARTKQMKGDRIPYVEALVKAGVTCEISPILEDLGIQHHCQRQISGCHERRKSSSGGSRMQRANLIPACSWCNEKIEDAVGEDRYEIEHSYLVVREGNPEWAQLSKRNDRLDTDEDEG